MIKILTFGVYDFFHLGHLRLFKQCREYGDYIIVAVQEDDYILKFKPNAKKLYSLDERKELIESIKFVDEVISYSEITVENIKDIDFDVIAFGEDQKGERFDKVIKWCKDNGRKVIRLKRTQGICSSAIKQELME